MTNRLSNIFNGLKDMFFDMITSAVEVNYPRLKSMGLPSRTRRSGC